MDEVTVEKLISNGRGLARYSDGRVIFIEGALPGERWSIEDIVKRKGCFWATGKRLTDVPERMEPACPHYGTCGGCALLHIHPRFELKFKVDYLRDVLSRVGDLNLTDIKSVDFPPAQSRIRGKLHVDQAGNIGFHQERANRVTPIKTCHVLPTSLMALIPNLAKVIKTARFEGDIYFMTNAKCLDPKLELQGSVKVGGADEEIWSELPVSGLLLRDVDGTPLLSLGDPNTAFQWGEFKVSLPPRSFVQSNPASWPVFGEAVSNYLAQWQPERVWDAHAGAGFLSSFLRGVEVWVSEPNRHTFDQLRENLKHMGMPHRAFQGTAEAAIKRNFFQAKAHDGLILDPPREGLTNPLRQWVVDKGPNSLLYFSCDMGSFARDLRHLMEGYRLENPMTVMNVNPGTLRIEVAAVLLRR